MGGAIADPVDQSGVSNAEAAAPPIPAPTTPVARPRRIGSNQALTNGIPTANVAPLMPSRNAAVSSIG